MQTMASNYKKLPGIHSNAAAAEILDEDSAPAYFQKLVCKCLGDWHNEKLWKF